MTASLQRIGGKRIVVFDCRGCKNSAHLMDSNCRTCVLNQLKQFDKFDLISLIQGFRRTYSYEQTKILLELSSKFDLISKKITKHFTPPIPNADRYLSEIKSLVVKDPIRAYTIAKEQSLIDIPRSPRYRPIFEEYKTLMAEIADILQGTEIFNLAKKVDKLDKSIYATVFSSLAVPSFVTSYVVPRPPLNSKKLETYKVGKNNITIYKLPGKSEYFYVISPPEFLLHVDESNAISRALEEISQKEPEIVDPKNARTYFAKLAREVIGRNLKANPSRIDELADIAARYSAGYGLLETLLADERIQDVYIDSPGNDFVYIYHDKYETCITNLILSKFDLEKISARLRALSGRPFDESVPVLHMEIPEYKIRVAGLCPPATFDGIGFAFRRSRPKPWTLPQFINHGMMSTEVAGLISFLVDGEASILITGARGSGKTSLLASFLSEINPTYRIIVIEDTPELPVNQLKSIGFKIQHMKVRASLGDENEDTYELTAEAALRTALRLGESVLVLGEVRGPEARALFEAMRIGAAGNVVLGTIHGSSAYDTWDRIVNDLNVPTTSFKATDVVISTASIKRASDTVRKRRLMAITEVKKEWEHDPYHEDGFYDLVTYDPYEDRWLLSNLKKSEILKRIARLKGLTMKQVLDEIELRGLAKGLLVKLAGEDGKKDMLEVGFTARFNQEVNRMIWDYFYTKGWGKTKVIKQLEEHLLSY